MATPSSESGPTIPSVDRAWDLMELAYSDDNLTVLGWADDSVITYARPAPTRAIQFVVTPEVQHSHEDEVLIIAVRVPHPDEMSLPDVLRDRSAETRVHSGGSGRPGDLQEGNP